MLLAIAWLGFAAGARAELLGFEGRLVTVLPGLGETLLGSGTGVAEIDGVQLGSLEILGASIAGSVGVPVTDPGAAPLTSIRLEASLGTGHIGIDAFGGPFGEPILTAPALPVRGRLQACMLIAPLPPCIGGFHLPLSASSGAIGVGIGGLITFGGSATLRVSLLGAPFTLNTAFATGTTPDGDPFTLFSAGSMGGPSYFTSTAGQPGGFLSLVTPMRTTGFQGGGSSNRTPGFLRVEIRFLPEPGWALLLVSGGLGLAALGSRRRRGSSRDGP